MAFDFGQLGFGLVIALKDMFTQNAQRISGSMSGLASQSAQTAATMQRSFGQVMAGAGMVGAGMAAIALPTALLLTTRETQKALGEMASLGTKDLHTLEKAAAEFSNEWAGTTKAQFIGASYDIKSAIATLSDEAVAEFAKLAALTGKATKATTQEMSGLFSTGYGIYKGQFQDLSDMDWGRMFSGGISKAVQVFKTTGPQMADAIKNIGALAVSANIPMAEQLAILGQMQTTMPGAEAGTLYKNFIMKAGEAGKELGLQFTDAAGHMKGVVPIIQALQAKFPDLASQAAQIQIKKAFGSDEAVKFVLGMAGQIGNLEANIRDVGAAMKDGTALTMEMARAMNLDIGSRIEVLQQRWHNFLEILGAQLIPVITPVLDRFGQIILVVQKTAETFPGLTRTILTSVMAVGTLLTVAGTVVSAVGMLGLFRLGWAHLSLTIGGAASMIGSALVSAFLPIVIGMAASALLRRAWDRDIGGIRTTLTRWYGQASLIFETIGALFGTLTGSTGTMSADLAKRLKAAGLYEFTKQLSMGLYRVKLFSEGLVAGFSSGFQTVARVVVGIANIITLPLRPVLWLAGFLARQLGWLVPITAGIRSDRFTALGTAIGVAAGALVALIGTWRAWQLVQEARLGAVAMFQGAKASFAAWQWAAGAIANVWSRRLWDLSQSAQTLVARLSTMNAATIWSGATGRLSAMKAAFLANIQAAKAWAIATLQGARMALVSLATNARNAVFALGQMAVQYVRLGIQMAVTTAQAVFQRAVWLAMNFGSVVSSIGAVIASYARMGVALALSTARVVFQAGVWLAYQATVAGVSVITGIWTAAQWALNVALTANPVGAVIMGIVLLGAAVVGIVRHWDTFKTKLWELGAVLLDLPFLQPIKMAWQMAQSLWDALTGKISWSQAGANILITLGNGILSMITWPFRLVWKAFELVRQLLPFSDAQAGPFADLTASGASILSTIGAGILSVAGLPFRLLSGVFSWALEGAAGVWSGLGSIVSSGFEAATGLLTSLAPGLMSAVSSIFSGALETAGSIWGGLSDVLASGWEKAQGVLSSAWTGLKSWGSAAVNWTVGSPAGQPLPAPASTVSPGGPTVSTANPASIPGPLPGTLPVPPTIASRPLPPSAPLTIQPLVENAPAAITVAPTPVSFNPIISPPSASPTGPTFLSVNAPGIPSSTATPIPNPIGPTVTALNQTPTPPPVFTQTTTNAFTLPPERTRSTSFPNEFPTKEVQSNKELLATRTLRERTTVRETTRTTPASEGSSLEGVLSQLSAKLGEFGDRPIQLSVQLDGRQIAAAVYKDMQLRRVMAYE